MTFRNRENSSGFSKLFAPCIVLMKKVNTTQCIKTKFYGNS